MRMTIVLLLLITILDIIPLKVISDNNLINSDDDDDDDDDAHEGQDDKQEDDKDEDEDEDEEETDENLTENAENAPVDDETDETDDTSDEEWMNTALQDIAFYLRSHKFNDFDRRYHVNDSTAPKVSNLTKNETCGALLHVQSLLSLLTERCKGSEIEEAMQMVFCPPSERTCNSLLEIS
jgi:hypothetical protein